MRIKDTDRFHCAVLHGPSGWAYTYRHDGFDPCEDCQVKIHGKPVIVPGEIKSVKFPEMAGKLLRARDWKEIHARGWRVGPLGIRQLQLDR
jgi:hypothetical protein